MVGNWWHLAQTPTGRHARQLDPVAVEEEVARRRAEDADLGYDEAVAEVLGDRAAAHRDELGFPPKGRWVMRDGWDSQLSQGEPHPSFLGGATTVTRE